MELVRLERHGPVAQLPPARNQADDVVAGLTGAFDQQLRADRDSRPLTQQGGDVDTYPHLWARIIAAGNPNPEEPN